jgi:hypothetical protein
MRKSRFSEEQIIGILRSRRPERRRRRWSPARDQRHDVRQWNFHYWRARGFRGQRLKALEDENARLKPPAARWEAADR